MVTPIDPPVTVRDWIVGRSPATAPALTRQILSVLGADADAPEALTAERCLAAAARALDTVVAENRFERANALDLLAIDALATFAFEHASRSADAGAMASLARRAALTLSQRIHQRV